MQQGSALLWALAWIAGTTALAWATVTYAMPEFERKQRSAVVRTVASISKTPLSVDINGFTATLSGQVQDEQSRLKILNSLGVHTGLFAVNDKLRVASSEKPLNKNLMLPGIKDLAKSQFTQLSESAVSIPLRLPAINMTTDSGLITSPVRIRVAQLAASKPNTSSTPTETTATAGDIDQNKLPAVTVAMVGDKLSLKGLVSSQHETDLLVQLSTSTYSFKDLTNSIDVDKTLKASDWIDSLTELLPMMSSLQQPVVDIKQNRIFLSGVAPSRQVHDQIVSLVLASLGNYSLIERISIADSNTKAEQTPANEKNASVATVQEAPRKSAVVIDNSDNEQGSESVENYDYLAQKTTDENTDQAIVLTKASDDKLTISQTTDAATSIKQPDISAAVSETVSEIELDSKDSQPVELAETLKSTELTEAVTATKPSDTTETNERAATAEIAEATGSSEISEKSVDKIQVADATGVVETVATLKDSTIEAKSPERDNLQSSLAKLETLRILFESQSDVLTQESLKTLDQIADVLLTFPDINVSIEGHTDSTGSNEDNLTLSLSRAVAVRSHLVERGVSTFNLRTKGYGEEVPIASNETAEGRATNRRIEFTF